MKIAIQKCPAKGESLALVPRYKLQPYQGDANPDLALSRVGQPPSSHVMSILRCPPLPSGGGYRHYQERC